jgi:hypothetical protein
MKKTVLSKIGIWFVCGLVLLIAVFLILANTAVNHMLQMAAETHEEAETAHRQTAPAPGAVVLPPEGGYGGLQPQDGQKEKKSSTSNQAPDQQQSPVTQSESEHRPKTETEAKRENSFQYSAEIPAEKAEKIKEEITLEEKALVLSTLLKKFNPEELKLFTKMISDGLTVEEKKEAKAIFLKKLTEEEYNRLIKIAAKYGLSQGKDYTSSLKEKLK